MQHIETLRLFVRPDLEECNGMKLMLINKDHEYWMNDSDIKLDEVVINCEYHSEFTTDELRKLAIQTLKDKQERARAEAEVRCNVLQKKIDEMLFLTHE